MEILADSFYLVLPWPKSDSLPPSRKRAKELWLNRLYGQVIDRPVHLLKPVRRSRRNHQDVAFLEVVRLAVLNVLGGHLTGPGLPRFHGSAADDDGCASVHDIKNVGFLFMDLDVSIRGTLVGLYVVRI